ncbi:MAG: Na+-transporting methylmalonyl-CoA/oxaloacetate decarboxylase gamma subunit [Rhodothermales bacterium]|jgi:Na+-transporting methylmalonyl-CoA/oxaloacetate decarboxylase gamma subunit
MKPRRDDQEGVELFPFLSILACVIGALTLLISFLSVVQLQAGDRAPEEVARSTEYQKLEKRLAEEKEPLQELAAKIQTLSKRQAQLDAIRPRVLELRDTVTQLTSDDKSVREQLEKTKADLLTKQAGLKRLAAAESAKTETLDQKEAALLAAQLRQQPAVLIQRPTGGKTGNYVFVEATKEGFTLYDKPEPEKIPLAKAHTKRFLDLLAATKAKEDTTLVFLVRADGMPSFQRGEQLSRARAVRYGKLPIIGTERVDVSLFKRR